MLKSKVAKVGGKVREGVLFWWLLCTPRGGGGGGGEVFLEDLGLRLETFFFLSFFPFMRTATREVGGIQA